MMPMPPCCAMAMARRDSVTVSIAALEQRHVQADVPREPRATSTCAGQHRGVPRHQQHVVEGQGGRNERRFRRAGRVRAPFDASGVVLDAQAAAPWHFLYFLPLPHGHGSLRPTFGSSRRTVFTVRVVAADARAGCGDRGGAAIAAAVSLRTGALTMRTGGGFRFRIVEPQRRRLRRRTPQHGRHRRRGAPSTGAS